MTLVFQPETTVVRRKDGKACEAAFRLLAKEEVGLVLALQDEVLRHEQQPGLYYPLSAAEVKRMIEEQGAVMGVFVEGRLAAFHALFLPHMDSENLGRDVQLSTEALMRVAHMEAVCVHPEYRGNGLQKALIERLIRCLSDTPYDLLFLTASPFNLPSVKSGLASGFVICALKQKYGQKWRYILFRNRDVPFMEEKKDRIKVPVTDFARQQNAFEDGYVGVDIVGEGDQVWVTFAKAVPTLDAFLG